MEPAERNESNAAGDRITSMLPRTKQHDREADKSKALHPPRHGTLQVSAASGVLVGREIGVADEERRGDHWGDDRHDHPGEETVTPEQDQRHQRRADVCTHLHRMNLVIQNTFAQRHEDLRTR